MRETLLAVAAGLGVPRTLMTEAVHYLTAETAPMVRAQTAALEAAVGTGREVPWSSADERF